MSKHRRPVQPPRHDHARWSIMDSDWFSPSETAVNLCTLFGIQDQAFLSLITKFISGLIGIIDTLSPPQVIEFNDSCKARYKELYKLIFKVLSLSQNSTLSLTRNGGKPFIGIKSETELHFSFDPLLDREDVILDLRLTGKPRLYGLLSKALVRAIIALSEEGYYPDSYLDTLIPYCQCILTVGNFFNDLRGDDEVNMILASNKIQEYQKDPVPLHPEIQSLMNELISDMDLGRKAPNYCADLVRLRNNLDLSPYSPEDYHVSLKSTGTRVDGHSVNGLSASILECDIPYRLEQLIQYHSAYRKTPYPGCVQTMRSVQFVEQNKLDIRDINLFGNKAQDLSNWVHRRLASGLHRYLKCDCTFNQDLGRQWVRKMTIQAQSDGRNIYSCDIHAATDTISLEYQEAVLAIFFGKEIAEAWMEIAVKSAEVQYPNQKDRVPLTIKRGQPQGLKASFPAFALAHHILMRLVLIKTKHKDWLPNDLYRIVGDDNTMAPFDVDRTIRDTYHDLASKIGWEIQESKGYYYYCDEPELPVAEFCKVRYCAGKPLTPLPVKLALNIQQEDSRLAAWLFKAKYLGHVDIRDIDKIIQERMDCFTPERLYIIDLIRCELGPWMYIDHSQYPPLNGYHRINPVLINYFRTQLYRTTISMWLPSEYEKTLYEDYSEAKKRSLQFMEWLQYINEAADLSTDHKIWYLLDKQETLVNAIDTVIKDTSLSYAGLAIDVTAEEQSILEAACEIVNDYEIADPGNLYNTIKAALKILTRFTPRSEAKNSHHDARTVLAPYSVDYLEMSKLSIEDAQSEIEKVLQSSVEDFTSLFDDE